MGVDAVLYVEHSGKFTEKEVNKLAGELCSRIGAKYFWLDKTKKYGQLQHALSITDSNEPSIQRLTVNTFARYYGPGYERGNWVNLRAIGEFLEASITDSKVYYGSDSADVVELFDAEKRAELTAYWIKFGHEPYRSYSVTNNGHIEICEFCGDRPMHDVGGGGDREFWHCDGCNEKRVSSPMGTQVLEAGEDFFNYKKK